MTGAEQRNLTEEGLLGSVLFPAHGIFTTRLQFHPTEGLGFFPSFTLCKCSRDSSFLCTRKAPRHTSDVTTNQIRAARTQVTAGQTAELVDGTPPCLPPAEQHLFELSTFYAQAKYL